MITVSVSDIQKNPKVLSQSREPVSVVDKRKNINLGVFYPKMRNKWNVDELAGSLGKYISDDKKDIPWEQVRRECQKIRIEDVEKKYNLKK